MNLTMNTLITAFESAKKNKARFIGLKITTEGFDKDEIIINQSASFDAKLKYYRSAYDNDLIKTNCPIQIKISGFTYGNSFQEIESDLLM